MSEVQAFRAFVKERLVAAVEDICALFDRTVAEYEEQLCRSEQENQRKQQLLDQAMSPRVLLHKPASSPGLNQEITETPQIKEEPEEQRAPQDEEQLPVPVPESSAGSVRRLEQRQSEHREATSREDMISEPHVHSETEGRTDHEWTHPISCSPALMETEADGDHYEHVRDRSTKLYPQSKAPETTVHNTEMSEANGGVNTGAHQCSVCLKRFDSKGSLQIHLRVHTGEKPYSCSICQRAFSQKGNLEKHRRTHTGEKPYSCSTCNESFTQKSHLDGHRSAHTGEKPFISSTCNKTFARKYSLDLHWRLHTGERPYGCPVCQKTFTQKGHLKRHRTLHTGEKPYRCAVCQKAFADPSNFKRHTKAHREQQ